MAALAGANIGSGLDAADSAGDAASTQAAAADRSEALQKQMFDKQMELQEPFRAAGIAGQNRLLTLLGIDPNPQVGGGGGLLGSIIPVVNSLNPSGLSVNRNDPEFGKYAKDFSMSDFQADPGYGFRLSEGLKALDRQAAARGGLISGGALKAATRYGQEMGSQEYQNAFNRYQTNRANQLQPLGNLQAVGQSAASNQGSAAGSYGNNAGNMIMQGGEALAAGQLGRGNTIANALQTGISAYQNQQNFNNWLNNTRAPDPYVSTPMWT